MNWETEENHHDKPYSGLPVSQPRFEPNTFRVQIQSINAGPTRSLKPDVEPVVSTTDKKLTSLNDVRCLRPIFCLDVFPWHKCLNFLSMFDNISYNCTSLSEYIRVNLQILCFLIETNKLTGYLCQHIFTKSNQNNLLREKIYNPNPNYTHFTVASFAILDTPSAVILIYCHYKSLTEDMNLLQ